MILSRKLILLTVLVNLCLVNLTVAGNTEEENLQIIVNDRISGYKKYANGVKILFEHIIKKDFSYLFTNSMYFQSHISIMRNDKPEILWENFEKTYYHNRYAVYFQVDSNSDDSEVDISSMNTKLYYTYEGTSKQITLTDPIKSYHSLELLLNCHPKVEILEAKNLTDKIIRIFVRFHYKNREFAPLSNGRLRKENYLSIDLYKSNNFFVKIDNIVEADSFYNLEHHTNNVEMKQHQQALADIEKKFKKISVVLPTKKEIPKLLRSISNLGDSAGLDFISFVPGNEVTKEFYAKIPLKITVKGPYDNIGYFLDQVSRLNRIVAVDSITLSYPKKTDKDIHVNATCTMAIYRFTNQQEPKKYTSELAADVILAKKDIIDKKIKFLSELIKNSSLTVQVLGEVAQNAPANILWLTSLELSGSNMTLQGLAQDNRAIAKFVDKLKGKTDDLTNLGQELINQVENDKKLVHKGTGRYIQRVSLTSSKEQVIAGQNLKSFSLSCKIGMPSS